MHTRETRRRTSNLPARNAGRPLIKVMLGAAGIRGVMEAGVWGATPSYGPVAQ